MKTKNRTKLTAVILALLMLVSISPIAAFAETASLPENPASFSTTPGVIHYEDVTEFNAENNLDEEEMSAFPAEPSERGNDDFDEAAFLEWLEYLNENGLLPDEGAAEDAVYASEIKLFDTVAEDASNLNVFSMDLNASSTTAITKRYTVLVLDVSGSMYGLPIDALKVASSKFCEAKLKTGLANNEIAIVTYETSARVVSDFTNDNKKLQAAINSITDMNMTNMNAGLQYADNLLSKIPDAPGVVKNIVLMSDGMPNEGATASSGRYTYSDYSGYAYANAVYNTAVSLWAKNYNVYTLGFFHYIDPSVLGFANRFMQDLQNMGYYNVNDPYDLEFVFGEILKNMDDETPIIIIPGIMGSRLFSTQKGADDNNAGDVIWPPRVWPPGNKLALKEKVYTRDLKGVDQRVLSNNREYGTENTYQELVDGLCKAFDYKDPKYSKKKIYFFSYDWRQSNKETAQKLNKYINDLKVDEVDLVCHSMGGLVAAQYVGDYGTKKVNKIITAGTPYEGSPQIVVSTFTQNVTGNIFKDTALGLWKGMSSDLKSEYPSSAELVPFGSYVQDTKKMKWRSNPYSFTEKAKAMSLTEYKSTLDKMFKQNMKDRYKFQENLEKHYTTLLDYRYSYFAMGREQRTIDSLTFTDKYRYGLLIPATVTPYILSIDYAPKGSRGDETVPFDSSNMRNRIEKLSSERYVYFKTNHSGIVGHHESEGWSNKEINAQADKSLEWIVGTLKGQRVLHENYVEPPTDTLVVRVACPVDVDISIGGEHLSSSLDNFSDEASFGRMDIIGYNNDIKMFCIDYDPNYTITIAGTDDGMMDFSIAHYNENMRVMEERTVNDISITTGTHATTSTNFNNANANMNVTQPGEPAKNIPLVSAKSFELILSPGLWGSIITSDRELYYQEGSTVEVSAVPNAGYGFQYWEAGNNVAFDRLDNSTTSFVMPNEPTVLAAHFDKVIFGSAVSTNKGYTAGKVMLTHSGNHAIEYMIAPAVNAKGAKWKKIKPQDIKKGKLTTLSAAAKPGDKLWVRTDKSDNNPMSFNITFKAKAPNVKTTIKKSATGATGRIDIDFKKGSDKVDLRYLQYRIVSDKGFGGAWTNVPMSGVASNIYASEKQQVLVRYNSYNGETGTGSGFYTDNILKDPSVKKAGKITKKHVT